MEFSEIFGFLKILGRSVKVFLQNVKSIALITVLTLLPSSILFLLFTYLYQSATTYITNLLIIVCFTLVVSVELIFLYAYIAITHASVIATILASLSSYSPDKLSLQDLYTSFRAKWRSPTWKNLGGSLNPILRFMYFFAVVVPPVMSYPNPLKTTINIVLGVLIFIYASAFFTVADIIPVVEDGCERAEVLEKVKKLVQGQRLHGFMVNMFINLLWLISVWGFWMIVGDIGSFNLMVYGLFIVNSISMVTIVMSLVHTVYYFQCMEYHDQTIHLLGNFHYTAVSNDIA